MRLVDPCEFSGSISSFVWTNAVLEIQDRDEKLGWHQEIVQCLYIAVRDATDVHIFEYAIEAVKSLVVVRYSRLHEFVRDLPCIYNMPLSRTGAVSYPWINMSSEDVYYYHPLGSDITTQYRCTYVRSWKSHQIDLIEELPIKTTDSKSIKKGLTTHRLKLARLSVFSEGVNWDPSTETILPCIVESNKNVLLSEIALQL